MVSCKQSGRLLESTQDNFQVQVLDRPNRGKALLEQILINAEEIIKEVKTAFDVVHECVCLTGCTAGAHAMPNEYVGLNLEFQWVSCTISLWCRS